MADGPGVACHPRRRQQPGISGPNPWWRWGSRRPPKPFSPIFSLWAGVASVFPSTPLLPVSEPPYPGHPALTPPGPEDPATRPRPTPTPGPTRPDPGALGVSARGACLRSPQRGLTRSGLRGRQARTSRGRRPEASGKPGGRRRQAAAGRARGGGGIRACPLHRFGCRAGCSCARLRAGHLKIPARGTGPGPPSRLPATSAPPRPDSEPLSGSPRARARPATALRTAPASAQASEALRAAGGGARSGAGPSQGRSLWGGSYGGTRAGAGLNDRACAPEGQDAGRGGRDYEAVAGPARGGTRESKLAGQRARSGAGPCRGRTLEKSGGSCAEGRAEGRSPAVLWLQRAAWPARVECKHRWLRGFGTRMGGPGRTDARENPGAENRSSVCLTRARALPS